MSNYIKAIVSVATATAAEVAILVPTDNVMTQKVTGDTTITLQYGVGNSAAGALTLTLTMAGGGASSAVSNNNAIRNAIVEAQANPGSTPYLFPVGINGEAPINLATAHAITWT